MTKGETAEVPVARVIRGRVRDLGEMVVSRVLPAPGQRMVGPFIFWDHMGPVTMRETTPMAVRPHPHINLATVTYLFEGAIHHRDSVGSSQVIVPGDINWMTAGRGIVHSERTPEAMRGQPIMMHGIQLWIALPRAHEEVEPWFRHYPAAAIPAITQPNGVTMRVLAGQAYAQSSPVQVYSPMHYVEAHIPAGAELELPIAHADYDSALYVVDGTVSVASSSIERGELAVMVPEVTVRVSAPTGAHVMLLGGQHLDGERYIEWNFVSSRPERIAEAKEAWRAQTFPRVPGDDHEFIPLPE